MNLIKKKLSPPKVSARYMHTIPLTDRTKNYEKENEYCIERKHEILSSLSQKISDNLAFKFAKVNSKKKKIRKREEEQRLKRWEKFQRRQNQGHAISKAIIQSNMAKLII